jgi:hypothetical protein
MPIFTFQPPTFNIYFQNGAPLCDDDSRNWGDESFSDKSHGSKTTNASSLVTAVSDSANLQGVEIVAGRCHARSRARKYDNRWLIFTWQRTCKRAGHKEKREKGVTGKPGFYGAVYNKIGGGAMWASWKTL